MNNRLFIALMGLSLALNSCEDNTLQTRTYEANVPIYLAKSKFRQPVASDSPQPIGSTGRIYFKDNYLFLSDGDKGIHVINNYDPSNPENVSFIPVRGAKDLVIKGTKMYVGSFSDLLILDVQNPEQVEELGRMKNALEVTWPEHNPNYPIATVDTAKGIVVGWNLATVVDTVYEEDVINNRDMIWMADDVAMTTLESGNQLSARTQGTGGSLAGFSLYGNYIYAVNQWNMRTFDISDALDPQMVNDQMLWMEGETLFRLEDNLFVGTTSGMMIFDLDNPDAPSYRSEISHFTGCDPVVVEDDKAYVTVRAGSSCGTTGGWESQLMVIDVSNLDNPSTMATYEMDDPYGLGIKDEVLYLCDGKAGLKVYDAVDAFKITDNLIAQDSTIKAIDVIPLTSQIMVMQAEGISQYTFSETDGFNWLSTISTVQ